MGRSSLAWLARNTGTLLLALILALVVWVSAVVAADPNEERTYLRPIAITGQDADLLPIGEIPTQARVTLTAPRSVLAQLTNNPSLIDVWIDMDGLEAGEHTTPLHVSWELSPVRLNQVEPRNVDFELETIITRVLPVELSVEGDPPLGYRAGQPELTPTEVTISGRASLVSLAEQAQASIDIAGSVETERISAPVQVVDSQGVPISDITLTPKTITVNQPISLVRGYKNVVVKVETEGQIANGYRLTNISVTPLNVTVYSDNPLLVNALPGYVSTMPVNINGLSDDSEVRMELNLPEGISLVGEQSVLVQVSVAAIEGSLTVSLPVEAIGLPPELVAVLSPATVDVIVSGPLPVLDMITPASFRAVVDLTGLAGGVYQLSPIIDLVPDQVRVESLLPETVEVSIAPPTPTPTASPATPAPTATP